MNSKSRGLALVLLAIMLFSALCLPAYAQDGGEAQQVSYSSGYYKLLNDGQLHYVQAIPANTDIVISSDTPFSQLYILWHEMPERWSLSTDGVYYTEITNDRYIHQTYTLESPTKELHMLFDSQVVIAELYAFGPGEFPSWVQRWETLEEPADILVFSTHSDDELVFFGGLIPSYVAQGYKLEVVYMVRHIDGFNVMRTHELLNGLWTCGVKYYPEINPDATDGVYENMFLTELHYGRENFNRFQVEMIRKYKPLAIVGQDVKGEYGNLLHIFNVSCLIKSVDMAADESLFPESAEKYGAWDTQKFYLHLYEENKIVLNYEQPLGRFGGMTAIDVARLAFTYHVTQQKYGVVRDFNMDYDSHQFGLVRSTVGEDIYKNDILENTHR